MNTVPDVSFPVSATSSRQVVVYFSDIAGFSTFTEKIGDQEASRLANAILALQVEIIERGGEGQVLKFGGDSVLAIFHKPSVAMSRSLEIQRKLNEWRAREAAEISPALRVGLHMGEVSLKEGEQLEIISRQVNRAARVMDAAGDNQILASEVVIEAGRDFIDIPKEHLAIEYYGEYYLKGVGATEIYEIADLRFMQLKPPRIPASERIETALFGSFKSAGYKIAGRVGEGPHGVVYRAIRVRDEKMVALKALHPAFWEEEESRRKFASELVRLQELRLPGVIDIIDPHLQEKPPFFVMEWSEAKTMESQLQFGDFDRLAGVFRNLGIMLERIHSAGLIHGNIKPSNVLLEKDDQPRLLDFGMGYLTEGAKASTPANFMGPPAYIAPEVVQGGHRDPQSDIYSVGVLLFKVLTGVEPFRGESIHEVLEKTLHEDPPLPVLLRSSIPEALQSICLKAMEKSRDDRYRTLGEMVADLGRFLKKQDLAIRPTLYDNLLFYRAQRHMEQLQDWADQGLMSVEEKNRLIAQYEPMTRRGWAARLEGRSWHRWQLLFLLGAWTMVNAVGFEAVRPGKDASLFRPFLLMAPAVVGLVSGLLFWHARHFRLASVCSLLLIMGSPLAIAGLVGMGTSGDSVSVLSLFSPGAWLAIGGTFLLVSAPGMILARTRIHSFVAVMAMLFFYGAVLLQFGLVDDIQGRQWAALGWKTLPLMVAGFAVTEALICFGRSFQAGPWIGLSLGSMGVVLCLFGISLAAGPGTVPMAGLLGAFVACAAAIWAGASMALRNHFKHMARPATSLAILGSLLLVAAGLAYAGWEKNWPSAWGWFPLFGRSLPAPHLLLLPVTFAVCLIGCRLEHRVLLGFGLTLFAAAIHFMNLTYFNGVGLWTLTLFAGAALILFFAGTGDLRAHRGNAGDEVLDRPRESAV